MGKALRAFIGSAICLGLGAVAAPATAQAIHRCMVNGQPVYQQDPCTGVSSERLVTDRRGELVPQEPLPPRPVRPAASASAPDPAAAQVPAEGSGAARRAAASARNATNRVEAEADECLAWYRPMLREPGTAYRSAAKRDGGTLFMKIHSTDGHGGFSSKTAACEFDKDGHLDAEATRLQALRRGWGSTAAR